MIRRFKAFGLAVLAIAAMAALTAAAGQAAPVITTSVAGVSVHATGESVGERFTVDGVTTECKVSHYTGTATSGSSTLSMSPTYTSCTLAGTEITVHVATNECKYDFVATEKLKSTETYDHYKSHVGIKCPAGKSISIKGTGIECEATVGETNNTNLTTVDITVDLVNGQVTITPTVEGITATVTKDPFLCPFTSTGDKTGGKYFSEKGIVLTPASGTLTLSGS
jgi:opacity protein-like surface antigen